MARALCAFAVTGPLALVAGLIAIARIGIIVIAVVATTITTIATDTLDELVAKLLDGGFEVLPAFGVPVGAICAGNSVVAGESEVKHVGLVVAVVACHAGAEAGRGQRDGCLTHHGLVPVITVFVSPDSVDLCFDTVVGKRLIRESFGEKEKENEERRGRTGEGNKGELTSFPLQTTAMTESGLMPYFSGSNVFQPLLDPSFPNTT